LGIGYDQLRASLSAAFAEPFVYVDAHVAGKWGNLGDGSTNDTTKPIVFQIPDPRPGIQENKKIRMVAAGSKHSLALCEDGDVYS